MTETDLVFGFTGDIQNNSRAIKQLRALVSLGLRIDVLCFGTHEELRTWNDRIRIHVLSRPGGGGPRFFLAIHRAIRRRAATFRAKVFHASDLYVLAAMAQTARRQRAALVYDARELYAHMAATVGRPIVRRFWQEIEKWYIRRANLVLTVSNSIADALEKTYRIPRPLVLYNVPPLQAVERGNGLKSLVPIHDDQVVVLHQGQMQKQRGCERLLDAFREVSGACLVFLGGGPLRTALIEQARSMGLSERVFFLDPVPPDVLLPVTASADIGVTLLEDTCLNHRYALPNKLFEYLMAGLPVLSNDLPEISAVVRTFDTGMVVDLNDRPAFVRTLQHMVDDAGSRERWSKNSRKVFETYNWETSRDRLIEAYRKLLQADPNLRHESHIPFDPVRPDPYGRLR